MFDIQTQLYPKRETVIEWCQIYMFVIVHKKYEWINVLQEGLAFETKRSNQASWWKQLLTLTRRSTVNMSRDVGYYWLRIIIYITVSICVGTIYFDVGTGYLAILARGTYGGFVSGFMTFMSIGGFPSFIEETKVNNLIHEIIWKKCLLRTFYPLILTSWFSPLWNRFFTERGLMGIIE